MAIVNVSPLKFTACLLLLVFLFPEKSVAASNRIALVIGNSAYETSPLVNPVNDARDMASKLAELGFEVSVFTDQDRKGMREAIRDFGERLKKAQVGLFYFAGHGIQIKGNNYLIPVGTDVSSADEIEDESIDAYSVLRKMESAGNEVNIVILDACRNNPFARSFRSLEQGLAKMDGPIGSFIAYATAPGSVAADGSGKNGLYTEHLLQALSQPGLNIEQTFKAVRRGVSQDTRGVQIPWESSSLTGEFYFLPKAQEEPTSAVTHAPEAPVGYLQIIGNVPNAAVTVNKVARGQLDEAGVLNVSPLAGEEVEVSISAPGYQAINENVKLIPGKWRQFNVMLKPVKSDDAPFRDSTAKTSTSTEFAAACLHNSVIIGVRSEWRSSEQTTAVKINDPSMHALIFDSVKRQGLNVIDIPAESFNSDPAQIALPPPTDVNNSYWLKVFVSAQETPITTIQTNMKTVQGDITLQLVDLATNRVISESTTKFRKAGLDMGSVVNRELDASLPTQIHSLLSQACRE